jgi:hypothetical protein
LRSHVPIHVGYSLARLFVDGQATVALISIS